MNQRFWRMGKLFDNKIEKEGRLCNGSFKLSKKTRIYEENDFFNNSSASSMDYRLRHFYGQAYNFLVGQTFTTFMDIDSWPDTVDFQGPNALINRRQPQVRYTIPLKERQMSLAFPIEPPSVDLADDGIPEDASTVNHAPAWPGALKTSAVIFRPLALCGAGLRTGRLSLYGQRKAEGGADGEGHRVNLVLKYDLVR